MAANEPPAAPDQLPPTEPTGGAAAPPPDTRFLAGTPPSTGTEEAVPRPADGATVPTPPSLTRRAGGVAARFTAEIRLLDLMNVAALLVFAFFLMSFAVHNMDFWLHLATGRLLAGGQLAFGDNPFSYPATPYWANHSWLFDLGLYGLAQAGGGVETALGQVLLVGAKALLALLLAGVLLAIRRRGQGLWLPALGTALVLLALSPRFLVQPLCLSLLFLGLTLFLLTRPERTADRPGFWARLKARPVWWLPALFLLWVNLDAWFILGPLTVGLFLLGELLGALADRWGGRPAAVPRRRAGTLALVLVVGLLACLVNPYFYRAFTLPMELSYLLTGAADGLSHLLGVSIPVPDQLAAAGRTARLLLEHDRTFQLGLVTPFREGYFTPRAGLNAAGLAYFVLLTVSAVSFLLAWSGRPAEGEGEVRSWGPFLAWLFFALASVFQERMIPFFVVLAGPLTVLNVQDFLARQLGTQLRLSPGWRTWSLSARFLSFLGLLGLAALAWPGWLNARADEPLATHRVAWTVVPHPSLRATALQLGRLPEGDDRFFNFNLQLPSFCAWYCPGRKTFIDVYRLGLFEDRVVDYVRARRTLTRATAPPEWQEVFRAHGLDRVVLGDVQSGQAVPALRRLWFEPESWVQPRVGSLSLIFAWKDPAAAAKKPFGGKLLDMEALAFGPATADRSPDRGPGFEVPPTGLAAAFAEARAPTPWDADAAFLYGLYYDVYSPQKFRAFLIASNVAWWRAGVVPPGIGTSTVLTPASYVALVRFPGQVLPHPERFFSPAPALLAVRASRRALAESPAGAESYSTLVDAYHLLSNNQQEGPWAMSRGPRESSLRREGLLPFQVRTLRRVQFLVALNRLAALQPSMFEARRTLHDVYREIGFRDTALRHLEAALAGLRKEGADGPGERRNNARALLKRLEAQAEKERADVTKRREDYRLKTLSLSPVRKATFALFGSFEGEGKNPETSDMGLADEALDVLLKATEGSPEDQANGLVLQTQLLLLLGRTQEVQERLPVLDGLVEQLQKQSRLDPRRLSLQRQPDFPIFWTKVLLAGATGDYAAADTLLDEMQERLSSQASPRALFSGVRNVLDSFGYEALLRRQGLNHPSLVIRTRMVRQKNAQSLTLALHAASELSLLRGLLALERGDTRLAREQLRTSFLRGRDLANPTFGDYEPLIARGYLVVLDRERGKAEKK